MVTMGSAFTPPARGCDAVIAHAGHALLKAQLAGIFERILGPHQRALGTSRKIDQPGQQEAQRRAARQQRQRVLLGLGQWALAAIAAEKGARLGDVERTIALETPGIEADRDVVGEHVVAGKGEIDDAGNLIAEKEHIVGKQVGVDHALRQILWPDIAFEIIELGADEGAQSVLQGIGAGCGRIEQRPPARHRQRVGARHRKIQPGQMHLRQRLTDAGAMHRVRLARPRCPREN